jgi:hypothetical protein
MLQVDTAVFQARVCRGRRAAYVGGMLGPLPDRLLPPLHLPGHCGTVRRGGCAAAASSRRDATSLQQSLHAHERQLCPSQGVCTHCKTWLIWCSFLKFCVHKTCVVKLMYFMFYCVCVCVCCRRGVYYISFAHYPQFHVH